MLTRRSLLSLVAAVPGLAFLAPRTAKAESGRYEKYSDLVADLIEHATSHPGAVILSEDDPMTRTLGFTCQLKNGYEKRFHIRLSDLSRSFNRDFKGYPKGWVDGMRELIKTAEGREVLCLCYQAEASLRQIRHYNIKIDGTVISLQVSHA